MPRASNMLLQLSRSQSFLSSISFSIPVPGSRQNRRQVGPDQHHHQHAVIISIPVPGSRQNRRQVGPGQHHHADEHSGPRNQLRKLNDNTELYI